MNEKKIFSVSASAACFDRHGRIMPQRHSEDRKMEDRKMIHKRIKFVMISHSGMFALLCGVPAVNFSGIMLNAIFLSFIFLSWLLFKPA
ncbi:hypothetical protein L0337_39900 [candidate division KSB1 bacterium]|nr:hypothetical protein [candidate division KSB1 bacterium]